MLVILWSPTHPNQTTVLDMSKNSRLFRQASLFTFPAEWNCPSLEQLEAHMDRMRFVPTGPTQESSIGWIPPRGNQFDLLCESIDEALIMKVAIETRKVPSSAIKSGVEARAKQIEETEGRRPGKKEKKEIAEEVKLTLLPHAFPSKKAVLVWIDRKSNRIVVDSSSNGTNDEIMTILVQMFSDMNSAIQLRALTTQLSPSAAMASWLVTKESPVKFTIDRDTTLKSVDESKASVRYSRHALDIDEVVKHVENGKMPTQIAMTFNDRVSFVLCENQSFKNIETLDTVFEGAAEDAGSFDADVSLITRELSEMFDAMIETLDGLMLLGNDEGSAAQKLAALARDIAATAESRGEAVPA